MDEVAKFRRERRANFNAVGSARMRKAQFRGVQEIATKRRQSDFAHAKTSRRAIKRVPHNRMTQRREMYADLMCAAGVQRDFD